MMADYQPCNCAHSVEITAVARRAVERIKETRRELLITLSELNGILGDWEWCENKEHANFACNCKELGDESR